MFYFNDSPLFVNILACRGTDDLIMQSSPSGPMTVKKSHIAE